MQSLSDIRWCLIISINIYCGFTARWSRKKDPTSRDNQHAFVRQKIKEEKYEIDFESKKKKTPKRKEKQEHTITRARISIWDKIKYVICFRFHENGRCMFCDFPSDLFSEKSDWFSTGSLYVWASPGGLSRTGGRSRTYTITYCDSGDGSSGATEERKDAKRRPAIVRKTSRL